MNAAAVTQCQVTRRFGAGVEMLVKPAAAGAVDAARFPFEFDYFFAVPRLEWMTAELFRPEQNVAGRLQAQQDCSGPVIVRLVITCRRPGRQVANQTIAGDFELSDADAGAFDFTLIDTGGLNVTDEVSLPNMLHARLIALETLAEVTIGSAV